jgi:predicted membrane-bound spermidine synthase
LSGIAGLVYEVLWSRYLALFVGHGAYAQVLVLAVYLGGMAVGALAASDVSRRLRKPLHGYAVLEACLALFGLLFHPVFLGVTGLAYDTIFPMLGEAPWVGAARWGIAGLVILPQSMLLGATFPVMAASLLRSDPDRPGSGVALAYLLNTLGGAGGVLLAGFVLIGAFGFAGTSVAAATLNLLAAGIAWRSVRAGSLPPLEAPSTERGVPDEPSPRMRPRPGVDVDGTIGGQARHRDAVLLERLLLPVAVGTAVASFAYEIAWTRMLALVLGSATHAFELMLSAFILGLALGAYGVRSAADTLRTPVKALGLVQVAMALAALASLPIYGMTFAWLARLVEATAEAPGGYLLFNLGRYGIAALVMLPATVLAGAALPLLTAALLRADCGERAIGRAYGLNTLGAVGGSVLAGLVGLPVLGLRGLLMAGAAVDALLGVWILTGLAQGLSSEPREARVGHSRSTPPWLVVVATTISVVVFMGVARGPQFDPVVLTGGVFREGSLPEEGSRRVLYYEDGRTATVGAHLALPEGVTVLTTNGKPDASIGPLWRIEGRDTLPETPIPTGSDFTTQMMLGLLGLAHRPEATTAANIGHGSGITGTTLLTSPGLERLVNIEIEPLMVEASLVFMPVNAAVFRDPRSSFVFDDARAFFSYGGERFDLIVTEPSNPWVSGSAGLFTREFYGRLARSLSDDGVLVQWVQLYELTDDLFLSVLAALDRAFGSYRVYLIGETDVAIVATNGASLANPDWSMASTTAMRTFTAGIPEIRPAHLEALFLFDDRDVAPLLASAPRANSDFRPVLDLGAERARFDRAFAQGVYSFATSPFDLSRLTRDEPEPPGAHEPVPMRGLVSLVHGQRGAWLREAMQRGGAQTPEHFPDWQPELVHLQTFLALSSVDRQFGSWETWAQGFSKAAGDLHWGTTGWTDTTFYRHVRSFTDRAEAPPEARAVVDFHEAIATFDWARAARAADVLVGPVAAGAGWIFPATLLDGAVLAYLRTGRTPAARYAFDVLTPPTGRAPSHLRNRILDALISTAEARGQDRVQDPG